MSYVLRHLEAIEQHLDDLRERLKHRNGTCEVCGAYNATDIVALVAENELGDMLLRVRRMQCEPWAKEELTK